MSRIKPSVARLLVGVAISVALGWGAGTARAAITSMSPSNASTMTDASLLISWISSTNTTEYWLYVGSTLGTNDIHNSGSLGTSTSTTVSGLPTNGSTLHVRLWHLDEANWSNTDFTYTVFAVPSKWDGCGPCVGSGATDDAAVCSGYGRRSCLGQRNRAGMGAVTTDDHQPVVRCSIGVHIPHGVGSHRLATAVGE